MIGQRTIYASQGVTKLIVNTFWGLPQGGVISRVTYSTVAKQLEHIQRLACLYTTGAIRTTPTAAMELITGLVPLPVFIKQEAMASCYRLRVSSQWYQNGCGYTTIKCIMARQISESLF